MRKCPICMQEPFEKDECKNCGYSISCDYEAYPTFARLKNGTPSKAGRKQALEDWRKAEEQRAAEARRKAEASEAAAKKQREEQKRAAEEQRRADEKRRAEAAERKRQEEHNRKAKQESERQLQEKIVELKRQSEAAERKRQEEEKRQAEAKRQEEEKRELERRFEQLRAEAEETKRRQKVKEKRRRVILALFALLLVGEIAYTIHTRRAASKLPPMGKPRDDSVAVSEVLGETVDAGEPIATGKPVYAVEQTEPVEPIQTVVDVETQPEVTRLWVLSAQEYVGEAVIQSRYQYDGGGALTGKHVVCVGNSVIAGWENDETFTWNAQEKSLTSGNGETLYFNDAGQVVERGFSDIEERYLYTYDAEGYLSGYTINRNGRVDTEYYCVKTDLGNNRLQFDWFTTDEFMKDTRMWYTVFENGRILEYHYEYLEPYLETYSYVEMEYPVEEVPLYLKSIGLVADLF